MSIPMRTTDVDTQKRLDYIDSLEFEDVLGDFSQYRDEVKITAEEEQAVVSAGGIVCFVKGISLQHKADVLNSTLLAQLAANKAFDREKLTSEWYGKYREVLENVGWVISAFDFTKYKTTGSTLQVQTVVLEILAAIASQNALLITKAALAALKSLSPDKKGFKIWETSSHNSSNGNFQISPCIESEGNVAMALGCFHFSASSVDYAFLWYKYKSSSISLYQGAQTIVLNEQIYANVRRAITEKLGPKAVDYVAKLEI